MIHEAKLVKIGIIGNILKRRTHWERISSHIRNKDAQNIQVKEGHIFDGGRDVNSLADHNS
jgi:hypothetical protein